MKAEYGQGHRPMHLLVRQLQKRDWKQNSYLGTVNPESGFGKSVSNIFSHQMLFRDIITFDNTGE